MVEIIAKQVIFCFKLMFNDIHFMRNANDIQVHGKLL